jgi:energy-converting hydrogenase Eha subunit B
MKTKEYYYLLFTERYGQQDAQFTQYMYNTININPAYAGSRGALSIFCCIVRNGGKVRQLQMQYP